MQANGNLAQETGKIQQELKQEKSRSLQLEKELRRKESALAETAALLVLRKKAHVIWGDGEDAWSAPKIANKQLCWSQKLDKQVLAKRNPVQNLELH